MGNEREDPLRPRGADTSPGGPGGGEKTRLAEDGQAVAPGTVIVNVVGEEWGCGDNPLAVNVYLL